MNTNLKQFYVMVIKRFYGNSIYVTEAQITNEVMDVVNQMIDEVQTCTIRLAPLATFIQGIAGAITDTLENLGIKDAEGQNNVIAEGLKSRLSAWLKGKVGVFGAEFLEAYFAAWFDILVNNRRLKICINTTALNYKSRVAIALLGI